MYPPGITRGHATLRTYLSAPKYQPATFGRTDMHLEQLHDAASPFHVLQIAG
jgi:hypothetical protein